MSLARIAVRLALVEALRANTLVGGNVHDSIIGAFEADADGTLRTDEERPFIAVYTDAAKVEAEIELRSMKENGRTEIVLEWGVTAAMSATDPETGESIIEGVGIPATDDAMEFQMDLVGRQIADVLTDPDNEWAEIFRSFCFSFASIDRERASNDRDGIRLAGHQMKITAALIDDPVKGEALPEAFAALFDRLDAHASATVRTKSSLMRAQATGVATDWETLQRRLGMTAGELGALGEGPIEGDQTRETPAFGQGVIAVPGRPDETVTP